MTLSRSFSAEKSLVHIESGGGEAQGVGLLRPRAVATVSLLP